MRPGFREWLGGSDSCRRFQKTPIGAGVFRVSLDPRAIRRFRILSFAFVYSRLFLDFANGMTLTMTLATKDFPGFLRENPGSASANGSPANVGRLLNRGGLVEAERCLSQDGVQPAQRVFALEPPVEQRLVVAFRSPECRLASSGVAA